MRSIGKTMLLAATLAGFAPSLHAHRHATLRRELAALGAELDRDAERRAGTPRAAGAAPPALE